MTPACVTTLHRHAPPPRECSGCRRRVCGPDDLLHTASGAVAICADCWLRWRDSGYTRRVVG